MLAEKGDMKPTRLNIKFPSLYLLILESRRLLGWIVKSCNEPAEVLFRHLVDNWKNSHILQQFFQKESNVKLHNIELKYNINETLPGQCQSGISCILPLRTSYVPSERKRYSDNQHSLCGSVDFRAANSYMQEKLVESSPNPN